MSSSVPLPDQSTVLNPGDSNIECKVVFRERINNEI